MPKKKLFYGVGFGLYQSFCMNWKLNTSEYRTNKKQNPKFIFRTNEDSNWAIQ